MTFIGQMRDGVVVFPGPVAIPDGAEVSVSPTPAQVEQRSVWDRLHDVVGKAEGLPADASSRVDYYLTHGLPRE